MFGAICALVLYSLRFSGKLLRSARYSFNGLQLAVSSTRAIGTRAASCQCGTATHNSRSRFTTVGTPLTAGTTCTVI
jgi:hypothetical protein